MKYEWNDGYRSKVKAEVAGVLLEEIRISNGGSLTPELVLKAAQDKASPLHIQFEWDNAAAAMEWRLYEARALIRSLRVVTDEKGPRRFYVHVNDGEAQGYITTEQMFASPSLREQVLKDALKALKSWQARYQELTELKPLFRQAERLVKRYGGTEHVAPSQTVYHPGKRDEKRPTLP